MKTKAEEKKKLRRFGKQIEFEGKENRTHFAAGNLLLNPMDFIIHSSEAYLFDLWRVL